MNWTVISAVNNQEVLNTCLLASPEVKDAEDIILQSGYSSAAAAYNQAMDRAKTDVLILAHQDVYLPAGWVEKLRQTLDHLAKADPNWAVLGVWGVNAAGEGVGNVYCTSAMETHGEGYEGVKEARTLDELLLVVRKSSGVRFDERLAGFHLYGTDICLEAERRGMKCYAISAFCIHNTNGYQMLPWDFWKSYLFMRRKWMQVLPVSAPCAKITFWCWPMIRINIRRSINTYLRKQKKGERLPDPGRLYRDNFSTGRVA